MQSWKQSLQNEDELSLAFVQLLRTGEGTQKLDEDELKMRARAIEAKCHEFDVEGRVTQSIRARW